MASNNLIGYVGGLAIATGVGAAIVVASQGTANADTGAPDAAPASESANEVNTGPKTKDTTTDAERPNPVSRVGSDVTSSSDSVTVETTSPASSRPTTPRVNRPTAEEVEATQVEKLRGLYAGKKPNPTAEPPAEVDIAPTDITDSGDTTLAQEHVAPPVEPADTPAVATLNEVLTPDSDSETNISTLSQVDGATNSPAAITEVDDPRVTVDVTAAEESVAWSPNPFRPMPPEPAPNDMPGVIWSVEQAILNIFSGSPAIQPFPREGFELIYRLSQMVPWVNVVVPLSNVFADLPGALAGDKNASQRIVNNLVITVQPLAMAYYGYNEIADVINLEQVALDFQMGFFATIWNILDPFQWLHNAGQSGLPLSTTTPPPYPPATESSG